VIISEEQKLQFQAAANCNQRK